MKIPVMAAFSAVLAVNVLAVDMATASASGIEPLAQWTLWPDNRLPRKAGVDGDQPAPYSTPLPEHPALAVAPAPLLLGGAPPSERLGDLVPAQRLPRAPFSVELWLVDHSNRPVGLMAAAVEPGGARRLAWRLTYEKQRLSFATAQTSAQTSAAFSGERVAGWRRYWHHLVGVWDGKTLRLYHNGEAVAETRADIDWPPRAQLELDAWLGAEPGAALADFVHDAAIYEVALDAAQVRAAFERRTAPVEDGRRYSGIAHFSAGPYLNAVTTDAVNVLWETDSPRPALLEWGDRLPLAHQAEIAAGERLQSYRIEGLRPGRAYFYRLRSPAAEDSAGPSLDSGTLSFRTAVAPGTPLRFVATADTEARPWVNRRLADAVWAQRPDFLLICGDLTDEGRGTDRWQWTHEYFAGLGALVARVPVIAAPGNGEGDLVWFRHYHALPGDEGYYRYRYGDVEFFVLDSNLEAREAREPGFRARQRAWLKAALAASDARWKVAALHHAPHSSDEDDYGDTWSSSTTTAGDTRVREDFQSVWENGGVDVVLYGHLHNYERTRPLTAGHIDRERGIVYVQLGGAGGNLEDFSPTRQPFSHTVFRDHHYAVVDVDGARMGFAVYDLEGRLRDRFDLEK